MLFVFFVLFLYFFFFSLFSSFFFFFFFNDTATTEIYTLSLHDALPIAQLCSRHGSCCHASAGNWADIARRTTGELSPSVTKRSSGKTGAGSVPLLPPGPYRRRAARRRHRRLAVPAGQTG